MGTFYIRWNAGYGDSVEEIEAENEEAAEKYAYESWREDVESHADFGVISEEEYEHLQ